jgi:hypothetical protein
MSALDLPQEELDRSVGLEASSSTAPSRPQPAERADEPLWIGSVLLLAIPFGIFLLDLLALAPDPWGDLGGAAVLLGLLYLIGIRLRASL